MAYNTMGHRTLRAERVSAARIALAAGVAGLLLLTRVQAQAPPPSATVEQRLSRLRQLPSDEWAREVNRLAVNIRSVNDPAKRAMLALDLCNLATEGDAGHEALQNVATTLADAMRDAPNAGGAEVAAIAYLSLAQLVRYEHVTSPVRSPRLDAALSQIDSDDAKRERADFTLRDIDGKSWNLKSLRGKVVVVNFWATWCPPCRKEIPDLQALYDMFKDRGLVILGISDEPAGTVAPFVASHHMTYPVLLDSSRTVYTEFMIQGIPRTIIYGRDGRIAAEAIDMRTRRQMLALLKQAGVE